MSNESDDCEFTIAFSDEEIDSMRWLVDTLKKICEHKRPNCDKARLALDVLKRTGEHRARLHDEIHHLEDVLHAHGLRKMDPSQLERLVPGELN